MIEAMRHRGPDDHGVYTDPTITLGMTRLAIIDVSPNGHQPMSNADESVWLAYNGETYNFQSERRILETKGHRFGSSSDSEVVLRMYEHYGDECLLRLRGIFALAIYDKRRGPGRERLLLARDHLGVKPLLYATIGHTLVFASEMKAMLASGLVKRELDPTSLRLLLTFGSVYQPRTMVNGVKMLLPGHRLVVEDGRHRTERYWSLGLNRRPGLKTVPYEQLVEEVSFALRDAVKLQLVSDVPLGAFLSGGVDSAILVAMMAREIGRNVKTFSVGFEAEGASIDESADAERTARYLGTDHTHVMVTGEEVSKRIGSIAAGLDQPTVDGVNSYFVSLAARRAVTVAISGTGGDEIFAGYPWFVQMALYEQKQQPDAKWKACARSAAAKACRFLPTNSSFLGRLARRFNGSSRDLAFLAEYAKCYHIFGSEGAASILAPDLREGANAGSPMAADLQEIDELRYGSAIERVTGLCLRGYTNNQLLRDIDAVSMAHSLEVRVPFLDPSVVDLALSLPDRAKVRDLRNDYNPAVTTYREIGAKRILLDVGRPLLPRDFDLQPKRGFAMPFDAWLRGPLLPVMTETLSESVVRQRGLLDIDGVGEVRDNFLKQRIGWPRPWLVMMLELWCREVLDGESPTLIHEPVVARN